MYILLNMLVISWPNKINHSKVNLINQSSIHLLCHSLDQIDQTAADSAQAHEDVTHNPDHQAEEDEPILPQFHVPYCQ